MANSKLTALRKTSQVLRTQVNNSEHLAHDSLVDIADLIDSVERELAKSPETFKDAPAEAGTQAWWTQADGEKILVVILSTRESGEGFIEVYQPSRESTHSAYVNDIVPVRELSKVNFSPLTSDEPVYLITPDDFRVAPYGTYIASAPFKSACDSDDDARAPKRLRHLGGGVWSCIHSETTLNVEDLAYNRHIVEAWGCVGRSD